MRGAFRRLFWCKCLAVIRKTSVGFHDIILARPGQFLHRCHTATSMTALWGGIDAHPFLQNVEIGGGVVPSPALGWIFISVGPRDFSVGLKFRCGRRRSCKGIANGGYLLCGIFTRQLRSATALRAGRINQLGIVHFGQHPAQFVWYVSRVWYSRSSAK